MFGLSFRRQTGTMARTGVARSLTVGTGFCTFLHRLAVVLVIALFLASSLLGNRQHAESRQGECYLCDAADLQNTHGNLLALDVDLTLRKFLTEMPSRWPCPSGQRTED